MLVDNPGVVTVSQTASPKQTLRQKTQRALGTLPPFSPILMRLLATLAEEPGHGVRQGHAVNSRSGVPAGYQVLRPITGRGVPGTGMMRMRSAEHQREVRCPWCGY